MIFRATLYERYTSAKEPVGLHDISFVYSRHARLAREAERSEG